MIVRVLEKVRRSTLLDEVYAATDSLVIAQAVEQHGAKAIMTSGEHLSGTDRVAEAARIIGLAADDIVVNVQGDQPLMDPLLVDEVVRPLMDDPCVPMSTLVYRIVRDEEIDYPNAVKTVMDQDGFAIYFSRATIPFFRGGKAEATYYKHHGIYAYRGDFLQTFASLPQGPLEKAEGLEQLRAIEHGHRIKTAVTDKDSIEVDTQADLERVRIEFARECDSTGKVLPPNPHPL
jgi:3-deoxy-manno-octulosonate cytidylyltransferase (CMP-KDO synthetase)